MKFQKKNMRSRHYLFIFAGVCFLLIGISVFAGGVLSPVKALATGILSPMQKGINSIGNGIFSWNENIKTKEQLKEDNKVLQEKIDSLKMQNRILSQDQVELERLQDLLKLKAKYKKYSTVGARVISKGPATGLKSLPSTKAAKTALRKT